MIISPKQQEYLLNAHARWNFKTGATRSGKTYIDTLAVIPKRLRTRAGKSGLNLFLGVTEMTLTRNIIEPLQAIYGTQLVSNISNNKAIIFGEKVYCLGAEKVNQVSKIQGSSIKYCYGDEVTAWNEEVFYMLQSRLDKDYSTFDGTCNPAYPKHWLKKFLESNADIYHQHYIIDDNPFLSVKFVENLKKEYAGTVFYKRYIMGIWALAEGLIYQDISENTQNFIIDKKDLPSNLQVNIGVDFGKNKSDTAFVATGISADNTLYVLYTKSVKMAGKTFEQLEYDFETFLLEYKNHYFDPMTQTDLYPLNQIYCDSAEPTYINSFRSKYQDLNIRSSVKNKIMQRIRATNILSSTKKIFFVSGLCESLVEGLCEAVWDETKPDDARLDNGTSNIDILDAFEYSWEYYMHRLVRL